MLPRNVEAPPYLHRPDVLFFRFLILLRSFCLTFSKSFYLLRCLSVWSPNCSLCSVDISQVCDSLYSQLSTKTTTDTGNTGVKLEVDLLSSLLLNKLKLVHQFSLDCKSLGKAIAQFSSMTLQLFPRNPRKSPALRCDAIFSEISLALREFIIH